MNYRMLLILLALALPMTIATRSHPSRAADMSQSTDAEKHAWGKSAQGIQIGLQVDSAVWEFGQIPTFKWCVRNNGPSKWKLPLSRQGYTLEVDGHLFVITGKPDKWQLLKPGDERHDYAIQADHHWVRDDTRPEGYVLALRPGTHTIRLGITLPPARRFLQPKAALVMSNPVAIEVIPLEGMAPDAELLGFTVFGYPRTAELSSWNRRWRDCAIDFESGRVAAMPGGIRKASENERIEWLREQGLDAVANISDKEGHGLIGVDLAVKKFEGDRWHETAAGKAQELIHNAEVTPGKTSMLVAAASGYGHYYAVKTSDGNVFMLDIGRGYRKKVRFHYRRVQQTVDSISVSRTTQLVGLPARPLIDQCTGIAIETPNNWSLSIGKDGSGSLDFGNAGGSRFPRDTFDFAKAYTSVAAVESGSSTRNERPYTIIFHIASTAHEDPGIRWPHSKSSFRISVPRHKNIAELFDKADALASQYVESKDEFEQIRKRHPIMPPVPDVQVEKGRRN